MSSDPFEFDEEFGPLTPRPRSQLVGGGGGGGGGGAQSYYGLGVGFRRQQAVINLTTNQLTKDNDMQLEFINSEARALAAETLADKKTEGIREKVITAVNVLSDELRDVNDGTVLSFAKDYDGTVYHFAAIKSNGHWYSTGSKTALTAGDDDELITWLVGLGIYDTEHFLAFAKAKEPGVIEATVSDG